jgi:hypothetical protein
MVKEFILTLKSLKHEILLLNILNPGLYILENTLLLRHNAFKVIICCLIALRNI